MDKTRLVPALALIFLLNALLFAHADEMGDLARVLRLEDRRSPAERLEPYTGADHSIEVRRLALRALGAVGDPAGCDTLLLYVNDPEESLARAAIRALGQLWYPNRLESLSNSPDDRALDILENAFSRDFHPAAKNPASLKADAIFAFARIARGKRAGPLVNFLRETLTARGESRVAQIKEALTGLFLAKPPGARQVAEEALRHPDAGVRTYAAIALGRLRQALATSALVAALADPDIFVRAEAARALGRFGGVKDPDLLLPLLESRRPVEVVGALYGYGRGRLGVPVAPCAAILREPRSKEDLRPFHLAVLDALGRRGDEAATNLLAAQLPRRGALRVRALKALGIAQAAGVLLALDPISLSGDPLALSAYLDALAACDMRQTRDRLGKFLKSPASLLGIRHDSRSRWALQSAAMSARAEGADSHLAQDLESEDKLIREIACDHLAKNPNLLLLDAALRSLNISVAAGHPSAAMSALAALEAVGKKFDAGSPVRRQILDRAGALLKEKELLVRSRAAGLIHALGGPAHPEAYFGLDTGHNLGYYQRIAQGLGKATRYRVRTSRGEFVVQVKNTHAPLFARRFQELVTAGFYKGGIIHRVEPNFVMQTGDPTGTGWGGSGTMVRDETGRLPFAAYAVGLATAGRDTGDSQWFVTHLDAPHLNGAYTAFGRVVKGMDVVDRLVLGDRIENISVLESQP